MTRIFHFTRIPGCEKESVNAYKFVLENYQYFGKTEQLQPRIKVIVIPCNNCNENHKYPNECELIQDSKHNVRGLSLMLNVKNSRFFISNQNQLRTILDDNRIIYCRYKIKSLFQKNVDNIIKFSPELNQWQQSSKNNNITFDHEPHNETPQYLSIFCPVKTKDIIIVCQPSESYRAKYKFGFFKEITASLKYGWNIFRICNYYYFTEYTLGNWLLYTKPQNEILSVSCYKKRFKMFILYDKAIVPSLFNLCLSSLFQYNLNSSLEKNKYILPTTICQQAPLCHFYHLIPFDVKLPQDCYHFHKTLRSSFICDW
jgi:hypothetical protein